jgi:hypothetical protein
VGWAHRRAGKVAAAAAGSDEGRLGGAEKRVGELWVGRRRWRKGRLGLVAGR